MNAMGEFMSGLAGLVIGLILTLLIFSYLLGDNPLYRLAVHILVGVSAAFAAVIVMQQVLAPIFAQIQANPTDPQNALWLIPLLFALLLVLKRLPATAWLGNSSLALMIGVGAGMALVGAVTGTFWPQVTAVSGNNALQKIIIALLTISVLLSFQFTALRRPATWQPPAWQHAIAIIGKVVLTITFGMLFANVLGTSITLLTDRINSIFTGILQLLS
ncbi:MAG: hypothetical protein Kow0080_14460 [Candidatus Promineifilaceae bacterium]